jgi:cell division cycle protein 20 (cofactor of APC complex)
MSSQQPLVQYNNHPDLAQSQQQGDRFISSRKNMEFSRYKIHKTGDEENSIPCQEYSNLLDQRMFDGNLQQAKILSLSNKAPTPQAGYQNNLRVLYSTNKIGGGAQSAHFAQAKKHHRHISQTPERILDAPGILDDFYLNLLDWSSQNCIAVALGDTVYLWNAESGSITKLMQTTEPNNYITSLAWIQDGNFLGVGTNYCATQIYDVQKQRQVRSMDGHTARVSSLAWNQHILSSGSRDKLIVNHDVRIREHKISTLAGHDQEVCGLKWNEAGTQLASGGNDNILNVWDAGSELPKFRLSQHNAAVKALAWCPWQTNLLASGGGTADRKLCFWNTSTGALLNSIDTKSQVCAIQWSKHDRELVSSHGFSQNQLCVWKYPSLVKIAELTGHESRVLHLASSPDGSTVVSGAGDETLRFWKVFSNASESKEATNKSELKPAFNPLIR